MCTARRWWPSKVWSTAAGSKWRRRRWRILTSIRWSSFSTWNRRRLLQPTTLAIIWLRRRLRVRIMVWWAGNSNRVACHRFVKRTTLWWPRLIGACYGRGRVMIRRTSVSPRRTVHAKIALQPEAPTTRLICQTRMISSTARRPTTQTRLSWSQRHQPKLKNCLQPTRPSSRKWRAAWITWIKTLNCELKSSTS